MATFNRNHARTRVSTARLRRAAAMAIAWKDMRAIGANIQVWLPMVLLPVIFGGVMPAVLLGVLRTKGVEAFGDVSFVDMLPPQLAGLAVGTTIEQQVGYFVLNYMFAPFFLLIPLMASSVISADSFAGEKERGTLESLLFSPVDVRTMLVGKALAAFLPAIALSGGTLAITAVVANGVGWPLFGQLFFPTISWLPLMFLVIPALSLAAILVNVFVSAKVATFQAAYQIGGVVVLPILALVFGQVSGLMLFDTGIIFALGIVLVLVDAALLAVLRGRLDRSRLFESQIR